MRAAQCTELARPADEVLTVQDVPLRPEFDPSDPAMKGFALVRVLACALAPGDVRVLSGRTRRFQGPPAMPYIPGGDVCGVVEAVWHGETSLCVGDCVVAQFHQNHGGLAEYAVVRTSFCALKPPNITAAEGAATASSGATALVIARNIRRGDRVLILGGAGGVGTFLVQLAKVQGAAFVAATSTQTELLQQLGVDEAIDYRNVDVWTLPRFQTPQGRFDVIVDLVQFGWERVVSAQPGTAIVRSASEGGRFLTPVVPVGKWFDANTVREIGWLMLRMLARRLDTTLFAFLHRQRPKHILMQGVGKTTDVHGTLQELFQHVSSGAVRVVLHNAVTMEFSTAGVRTAMNVQQSDHAHGKVVVAVARNDVAQ